MDARLARDLQKHLTDECKLHEQYLALLIKEQQHVIKLQSREVIAVAEQRSQLADLILQAHQKRLELVERIEPQSKRRISEVIAERASASERKVLVPLAARLKKSVEAVQRKAREFGQVVSFSLGMINGSVSVITAAARTRSRSYGSDAKVRSEELPKKSRSELVIKEA